MKPQLLALAMVFSFTCANAQSSFSLVKNVLQTSCSGNSCHSDGTPAANLSFDGTDAQLYNTIVGVAPANPVAAGKGYKLIDPGYPANSFLLKKLIHALDQSQTLEAAEGANMPSGGAPVPAKEDIEIIRQWILYGAKDTGTQFNAQIVRDYYQNGGLPRIAVPAAPPTGEGIQLHFGPVFLAPNEEVEFYKKEDLGWAVGQEVTNLSIEMNTESHHFIIYKYNPGSESQFEEGLRPLLTLTDAADMNFNATTVSTWQYERDHTLPTGTAYRWDAGTHIDLNYHINNYSSTDILAADVYVNVLTQPWGTAEQEMFSGLAFFGELNPFALNILNNATDTTFINEQVDPAATENIHLWLVQGHTHALGVDYDIYERNADGSKGTQIYEGYFDDDYVFNQGFFDWEHPPVREFNPLYEVDLTQGLIHEATYFNNGPAPVGFGLTTDKEMFVTYYQYTKGPVTVSVEEDILSEGTVRLYPNPTSDIALLDVGTLENGTAYTIEVFDLAGNRIKVLDNVSLPRKALDLSNVSPGMYLATVTLNGATTTLKLVKE